MHPARLWTKHGVREAVGEGVVGIRQDLVFLRRPCNRRLFPPSLTREAAWRRTCVTGLSEQITFAGEHAEIWRVFEDAHLFREVVKALANPWRSPPLTKVVGIEARGFILGAAVAHALGTGFVGIRKPGSLFAGAKVEAMTNRDYRGREHRLRARRESLTPEDQVILVDDWCETGNQALAALRLIE